LILIPCDIIYFPFENSHKACGRFLYCGPSGAGHFVKMIHNGIEYGVMQAYAEGFDILRGAGSDVLPDGYRYDFNAADIAELWRRGSVVGSWLLDLTAMALAGDPALTRYTGVVQDSCEGRWTIQAAIEESRKLFQGGIDCSLVRPFSLEAGAYICRKGVVGHAK
jgi:6-phosphogluconate dehydrogenase (decarboxylating)